MEEPVIKQYLDSAAKNATFTGKDSCYSLLKAMNSYFSYQVNEEIVVFADVGNSNSRKEIMGIYVAYSVKRPNASNWTSLGFFLFLLRKLRS